MSQPLLTINKASPPLQSFQSQSSFAQKILNFTFQLAQNPQSTQPTTFSGTNSNLLSVSGLRARCRFTFAKAPTSTLAEMSIYGLPQSVINQLTTTATVIDKVNKNSVIVSAGVSSTGSAAAASAVSAPPGGFPVVFGGTIWFSVGDYNQMPDVPLEISAQSGLFNAMQSAAPASFTGQTDVATAMQSIASKLGLAFENNNVSAKLSNPYYRGTLMEQVYRMAEDVHINAELVDGGTKLAIWPRPGSRTSITNIPLISPETGMIGYPLFSQNGYLIVKMIYNPDVVFGGSIQVKSSIPQANQTWVVRKVDLSLDTLSPDGDWMGTAYCQPINVPQAPPPAT